MEYDGQSEWVFTQIDGARTRIGKYADESANARELRINLHAAVKKPVRTVIAGKVYILEIRAFEKDGEHAFEVSVDPAPKLDPAVAPKFTAKQGQYLGLYSTTTRRSTA